MTIYHVLIAVLFAALTVLVVAFLRGANRKPVLDEFNGSSLFDNVTGVEASDIPRMNYEKYKLPNSADKL